MIEIVVASHNPKKKKELEQLLARFAKQVRWNSLPDSIPPVEEDGNTFRENAEKKAKEISLKLGCWVLADDSGLSVDALDGAPGVRSARYAGEPADTAKNNAKLLTALQGMPENLRTAHFTCAIALSDPQGKVRIYVEGQCRGKILNSPRGNKGFGYDPLFFYPPLAKTFAELAPEEKNQVSHRAMAVMLFSDKLERLLTETGLI